MQSIERLGYEVDDPRFESLPIPVAERSKAMICNGSLAEIVGSNPAGDMDACVVCCIIEANAQAKDNQEKRNKYGTRQAMYM